MSGVAVDTNVWSFKTDNGHIDNINGNVSDILFSSYKGVSGDAVIAVVQFNSINKGLSNITIEESLANPFASNGKTMTVSFETTNVVSN